MVSNTLGKEGITFIVERYQSMIGAPVEVFDGPGRASRIRPQYLPNGPTHGTGNSKGNSKKVKIARPPNAFILYRQHHHAEVVSQNPSIHNNQISVILGKQWQNESAEVKAKFRLMAEDIKKKHLHANPDYQYQPRRPTEKKRRMTRTKLGKMRAGEIASTEITYEETDIDVDLVTAPFEETSTGNAVFKMGENDIDGVALAAAVDNRNANLLAAANAPVLRDPPVPVIHHAQTEHVTDDANFYANLLNLDAMYPVSTEMREDPMDLPDDYDTAPVLPPVVIPETVDYLWLWDEAKVEKDE